MRVSELNWMQLERRLEHDDRIVLPVGTTEQHAYLSLATDTIIAERLAVEACEPIGVPVLPALPYGCSPAFTAFPGTPSLQLDTLVSVMGDVLDSLHRQGFRRFLIVNGHAGNSPAADRLTAWPRAHDGAQLVFHDWWTPARIAAVIADIDAEGSHANWLENFPWTRLPGVQMPAARKPMIAAERVSDDDPGGNRLLLGDGSYGGVYQRSDEDVLRLWAAAVEELRAAVEDGWS